MASGLMNIVGILLAAVAANIIGFLWYGKLFGKQWISLMGFSDKDIKKAKSKGMRQTYFVNFIATVLMALVLHYFLIATPLSSIFDNVRIAILLWLGFCVTILLGSVLWEGKSVKLYLINVFYWFVSLIVMALILAL